VGELAADMYRRFFFFSSNIHKLAFSCVWQGRTSVPHILPIQLIENHQNCRYCIYFFHQICREIWSTEATTYIW
jgi:hypothetical protein